MLPIIDLKLSSAYNHILSDDFNYVYFLENYNTSIIEFNKKFDNFKKITKPFQDSFKKNKNKIIKLIEKYSGFPWKGQYIPIYLVKMTKRPSISDPLTLKYYESVDSMLMLVIHELTHINLPEKIQLNAGPKIHEQWVNLITQYVALDMHLDLSKVTMKNFSESSELGWDLKSKPLKNFLKRNF